MAQPICYLCIGRKMASFHLKQSTPKNIFIARKLINQVTQNPQIPTYLLKPTRLESKRTLLKK